VQRRQAEKYAGRDAQIAADREAAYEQQTAPPPQEAPPAPAPASVDVVEQLKGLADLKAQGILTEEEFAAQKAKILGG
jgi:hypothetical protein